MLNIWAWTRRASSRNWLSLSIFAFALVLFASPVVCADTLTVTSSSLAATEGAVVTATLGTFTDSDTDPISDYAAAINWGDGSTSAGSVTGAGTFSIAGTHIYTEEGNYTLSIDVIDSGGASSTVTGTATVGDAPITASASSFSFTPGVSTVFSGSFTDGNPIGTASDFSAPIDWGDGTTSVGTVGLSSGIGVVLGSHTYASGGSFVVSLTVNDVGGSTATATTTATSTVPEPSSMLLLGTGLVGLIGIGLRRKLLA